MLGVGVGNLERSDILSTTPQPCVHGVFLCCVETVKRFENVYLHCNISNLMRISKMSTLVPPGKISADAHALVALAKVTPRIHDLITERHQQNSR